MRKQLIIMISTLISVLLLIWFSCNPFNLEAAKNQNFDVLDSTDIVRATGVGAIGWGEATTGGTGGTVYYITDKATLERILYQDDNPAIIVIQNDLSGGPDMINVKSNKTIVGAGSGVKLNFGFYLRGSNIIIRNLDIMNGGFNEGDSEGLDGVTWAQDLSYVWIDHCTFHEALDGLVDPTRNARFVTISYCHFYHQKTAVLIGASDSDSAAEAAQANADKSQWHYTVTIHNCYFNDCYERSPRVRYGAVHMFNNYISNCPTYAVGRGVGANIYSENNYFYNTTQVWKAWDTTSKPGYVEDVGSLFEGNNGDITDRPPTGSWIWNPKDYYNYTAQSAEWVKANVPSQAGVGKITISY